MSGAASAVKGLVIRLDMGIGTGALSIAETGGSGVTGDVLLEKETPDLAPGESGGEGMQSGAFSGGLVPDMSAGDGAVISDAGIGNRGACWGLASSPMLLACAELTDCSVDVVSGLHCVSGYALCRRYTYMYILSSSSDISRNHQKLK